MTTNTHGNLQIHNDFGKIRLLWPKATNLQLYQEYNHLI